MKGRKPILCVWIPNASEEQCDKVSASVLDKVDNEYHVIVISEHNENSKVKLELLGTRNLSKAKYQTILNAMNKIS